jgi:hypothetical protein
MYQVMKRILKKDLGIIMSIIDGTKSNHPLLSITKRFCYYIIGESVPSWVN